MKISIVIPCYNAEKYLKECLNSCLSASHEMIEVICVDDGSTDKTKLIIDSYECTYSCVRSITHKENLGTLEARRSGSLAATGDYVLFLDPDDILEPQIIERISEQVSCRHHEALFFGFDIFGDCSETRKRIWEAWKNGRPSLDSIFTRKEKWPASVCFCAWDRNLINKAFNLMPSGYCIICEDGMLLLVLLLLLKDMTYIDAVGYRYRLNDGITSVSKTMTIDGFLKKIRSNLYIVKFGEIFQALFSEHYRYFLVFKAKFFDSFYPEIVTYLARGVAVSDLESKTASYPDIANAILQAWSEREQMVADYFLELGRCRFVRMSVKFQRIVLGVIELFKRDKDSLTYRRTILKKVRKLLS